MAAQNPIPIRLAATAGAALVLALVGSALFGADGVVRHEQLKDELAKVEALNADLQTKNSQLTRESEALQKDGPYLESVVRDELGFVGPDEMIFIFEGSPKAGGMTAQVMGELTATEAP